jgi:transcriptional pleiotropic regulator of transition state genes
MDTGIVRKVDELGRLVIPAETRRLFNISEGDELSIWVEGSNIMLRKLEDVCVFDGSTEDVSRYRGRGVCATCRMELTA